MLCQFLVKGIRQNKQFTAWFCWANFHYSDSSTVYNYFYSFMC